MNFILVTLLVFFVGAMSVNSQDMPIFGTMTICTEPGFGGVCHNQIVATPSTFCNNLATTPLSVRPWENTYCWLWTGASCTGSFTEVGPSGAPLLNRVYLTTTCNITST